MSKEIPIMPNEFKGEELTKTEYIKNTPRKWTKEEIEWCLKLKEQGYTNKEIAISVGREDVSVSIKLKRLTKKNDTYNKKHILDKYNVNELYYQDLKPKTILDVYCGQKSYWRNSSEAQVTTNDKDIKIEADYHMDALKFLCQQYIGNNKYDLIDLDPFGSAYECLDLAIKMAKKGLIVTLGEMGHKRFKRLDYVKRMYGIESLEDFTSEMIVKEIQKIGLKNKKLLHVHTLKDWQGISRVWFTIEECKITEQWKKENDTYEKL